MKKNLIKLSTAFISIPFVLCVFSFNVLAAQTPSIDDINQVTSIIEKTFNSDAQFLTIDNSKSATRYVYTDEHYKYEADKDNNIVRIKILPDYANHRITPRSAITSEEAKEIASSYIESCIGKEIVGELEYKINLQNTGRYFVDAIEKINGLETGTSCGIGMDSDGTLVTARFTLGVPEIIASVDKSTLIVETVAKEIALSNIEAKSEEVIHELTAELHTNSNGIIYWYVTVPTNQSGYDHSYVKNYYVQINALTKEIISIYEDFI